MADDEKKIDVIIALDPENPSRQGKKESLPASEAYNLIQTGRARAADGEGEGEKATKKSDKGSTL